MFFGLRKQMYYKSAIKSVINVTNATLIKIQKVICFDVIQISPVESGINNFFHIRIIIAVNNFLPIFFPKFHPNFIVITVVFFL